MFAETPSRLQRAKTALLDLAETMKMHGGHRLALVVFAGRAKLACPLTHDYDHFREAVEAVDTEAPDPELEPGPGAVSGTRIGAAIHEALLAHDPRPQFRGARDILLLSDGDDPAHDGEWREGAVEAHEQGVPIYTVGLGDPDASSVIRIDGNALKHDGKEVRTRLEEGPLRDIADRTHGVYFPAHTRTLPLGEVYLNAVAGQRRREESDNALPVYAQHYLWFLAAGFVFMALAVVIGERRRSVALTVAAVAAAPFPAASENAVNNKLLQIGLILLALLCIRPESSPDWQTLLRQGDAAYAPAITRRRRPCTTGPATARRIRDSSRLTWPRRSIVWLWRRRRIAAAWRGRRNNRTVAASRLEMHGERRRCTASAMLSC